MTVLTKSNSKFKLIYMTHFLLGQRDGMILGIHPEWQLCLITDLFDLILQISLESKTSHISKNINSCNPRHLATRSSTPPTLHTYSPFCWSRTLIRTSVGKVLYGGCSSRSNLQCLRVGEGLVLKDIYLFICLCWVLVAASGIVIFSCGIFHCSSWAQ